MLKIHKCIVLGTVIQAVNGALAVDVQACLQQHSCVCGSDSK